MVWIIVALWLMGIFLTVLAWDGIGDLGKLTPRRIEQCPACSYSLAGLVDGAACPECGEHDVMAAAIRSQRRYRRDGWLFAAAILLCPAFTVLTIGVSMLAVVPPYDLGPPLLMAPFLLIQFAAVTGLLWSKVARLTRLHACTVLVVASGSVLFGDILFMAALYRATYPMYPMFMAGVCSLPILGLPFMGYGLMLVLWMNRRR